MEYIATTDPTPDEDIVDVSRGSDCPRLLNGLYPVAGHCDRCTDALRASVPREYRIRDTNGHIITADWVM